VTQQYWQLRNVGRDPPRVTNLAWIGFSTFIQWWLATPDWGDKLIQSEQVGGTGS
jgi:hypothetical protein